LASHAKAHTPILAQFLAETVPVRFSIWWTGRMQLPDPGVLEQVGDSLTDFALGHVWQWLAGLVVAAMIATRAYFRGVRSSALYLLLGAVLGIGGMVTLTALLVWSRYAVYSAIGALSLALLFRSAVIHRQREQARLHGVEKGLFDFVKDSGRATKVALAAWDRISRIQSTRSKELESSVKTLNANVGNLTVGERITTKVAKGTNRAARQIDSQITLLESSVAQFMAAEHGRLQWLIAADATDKLEVQRTALEQFRVVSVSNREATLALRQSTVALPKMSRESNAANAAFISSLDRLVAVVDRTISGCDEMLALLN